MGPTHNLFCGLVFTVVLQINSARISTLEHGGILPHMTCPQLLFNCSTTDLPGTSLRWFFNDEDTAIVSYSYVPNDVYPMDIIELNPDVVLQITNAFLSSSNMDNSNFESALIVNISTLRLHGVQNITCGSFGTRSNRVTPNLDTATFPPLSSISCSLLSPPGGPEVTFQWPLSSTSTYTVEKYNVTVNPDPSSCSSDQVNPSGDYSCSGLSLGTSYSITVSAINCGDQEGPRDTFTILPQVANSPTDISILTTYNDDALQELGVQWADQSPPTSGRCFTESSLNYTVVIETDAGVRVDQKIVSSDSCSENCSVTFLNLTSNQSYQAIVIASNIFGLSNRAVHPKVIDGLLQDFHLSLSFESCVTSANCSSSSSSEGECVVQYGQDPTYQEQGPPISGPFNSPFSLPLMEASTLYYFTFMLTVNSTRIQVNRNFTTGEFASHLTYVNIGLLSVGVFVFLVALILCVLALLIVVSKTKRLASNTRKKKILLAIFFIVAFLLLALTLALLVAFSVVTGQQSNTCDSTWQSERDALIISAFVYSFLALLSVLGSLILVIIFIKDNQIVPVGDSTSNTKLSNFIKNEDHPVTEERSHPITKNNKERSHPDTKHNKDKQRQHPVTKSNKERSHPVTKSNKERSQPDTEHNKDKERQHPVTKSNKEKLHPVTKSNKERSHPVTKNNKEKLHSITKSNKERSHPDTKHNKDKERQHPVTKSNKEKLHPVTKSNKERPHPDKGNKERPHPVTKSNNERPHPDTKGYKERPHPDAKSNKERLHPDNKGNKERSHPDTKSNKETPHPDTKCNKIASQHYK